ncbi:unnamed protein product [Polarella glacialis]|nr:unnamed protein product [Polarella glacialis]CAE8623931.1 unnamed protein product [Polarella glacialis]CAE8624145.1 unnamed protein product [Polarella glacialis]
MGRSCRCVGARRYGVARLTCRRKAVVFREERQLQQGRFGSQLGGVVRRLSRLLLNPLTMFGIGQLWGGAPKVGSSDLVVSRDSRDKFEYWQHENGGFLPTKQQADFGFSR